MSSRALLGALALFLLLPAAAPAAALPEAPAPAGEPGVTGGADGGSIEPSFDATPSPAPPAAKRRASQWNTISEDPGPTQNCVNGYYEPLGGTYNGWYGEIGVTPQVNQTYLTNVGWFVSGFPCGGGAQTHVEIVLPAHTQLAINGNNPVLCYYKPRNQSGYQRFTGGCPQGPTGTGMYGGYSFDPPGDSAWATATGAAFELQIPVRTTRPLNGQLPPNGQPCSTCFYAGIWMIDGVFSPWTWPRTPVYVGGTASTTEPYVTYPGPSTTDITYDSGSGKAGARTNANIFTEGTTGIGYFQMGFKEGDYIARSDNVNVNTPGNWIVWQSWEMTPGKTYHWRSCYEPSAGQKVCGSDQTFQAPPDTAIGEVKASKRKRKATVTFASPTSGMSFQCSLDGGAYKPCTSPKVYSNLSRGGHDVRVRAKDTYGNKDATPAKEAFKI